MRLRIEPKRLCARVYIRSSAIIGALLVLCASGESRVAAQSRPTSAARAASLEQARELTERSHAYYQQGRYDAALPLAERALEICEQALEPDHPTLVTLLSNLAELHRARGDFRRALPLLERSLGIAERAHGRHHPDVAKVLNNLAWMYHDKGDHARALPLYQRSLAIREKLLGSHHPDVATVLNNLAHLYEDKGDYERALPLQRRALAIWEQAHGPNHPDVAIALSGLAALHSAKGDYDRALPLLERSLRIREQALGPSHPDVAMALDNLANLYREKGDYERALPLMERSVRIAEKVQGPNHPDVATALSNLAVLLQTNGDSRRALPLVERSLAIREQALGPDHPDVATSLLNLAAMYEAARDYQRALPLCERALAIKAKALGPHHPEVGMSLNNLAALYIQKGDHERALLLMERALLIQENALGLYHPDVARSVNNLAVLHFARGDPQRALPLYQRALGIWEKMLGPHHPDVATALSNLSGVYQVLGDYQRALPLLERALTIRTKALGEHHPDVAIVLTNLAWLYMATRDYPRALSLMERSVAIREKALGPQHPDVGISASNLAAIHWLQGNVAEAVVHLKRSLDAVEAHIRLVSAGDATRARQLLLAQGSHHLDVAINMALQHDEPQAKRLALETLLARKGRVLDVVSDAFARLRGRAGPDERRLLDEYRENRTAYAREMLRGPEGMAPARHRRSLEKLQQRAQELEQRIAARSDEFRGQMRSVTLADVQAALPEGTVFVEWVRYRTVDFESMPEWLGAERYAASILARSGDPVWLDLGAAEPIDAAIAVWRSALARELVLDVTNKAGRELDALVMAPVRAHLGSAKHVFLAPDGPLHLVPFAALVDEQGGYLVERYLFTYLTSARDLLRLQEHRVARARSPALIVADPQYGVPGRSDSLGFRPLRETIAEAQAVQSVLPGAILLTGVRATETALKRVRGPAIVHIATHGYFAPVACGVSETELGNASLQSGLALAGANACLDPDARAGRMDDGLLTALEAASLDLYGTELAVLSACDTAVGATGIHDAFLERDIGRADGVYGLRRALVLAGARTQMVSLWTVGDATTGRLMSAYYRKIASGKGRSEALREVQMELLKTDGASHPRHWASFIVSGDPTPIASSHARQ